MDEVIWRSQTGCITMINNCDSSIKGNPDYREAFINLSSVSPLS